MFGTSNIFWDIYDILDIGDWDNTVLVHMYLYKINSTLYEL